jgi:hypothetical protein
MKKIIKNKTVILVFGLILLGFTTKAVPVIGLPGQGFPVYSHSSNSMGCEPGWHWCEMIKLSKMTDMSIAFVLEDPISLSEPSSSSSVTLSFDFETMRKKFSKMFVKNQLIITAPIGLGSEISNELNKQLKSKNKIELILKSGQYSLEIVGKVCTVKGVKLGLIDELRKK